MEMRSMLIQSIIERDGGTHVTIDKTAYHFTADQTGAHVADVEDRAHIARFLSISEGYCIPGTTPREEHKPVHAPVEEVAPEPGPLKRHKSFPESFTIGGVALSLDDVIAQVLASEDLTADQWALLEDYEQADKIESRLDALSDEADLREQQAAIEQAEADAKAKADTNGDGVVDNAEERAVLVAKHVELFGSKPHHKASAAKIRDAIAKEVANRAAEA